MNVPTRTLIIDDTVAAHDDTHSASNNPRARLGQYVKLRVSDPGMGIPPEWIEPFFSALRTALNGALGLWNSASHVSAARPISHLKGSPVLARHLVTWPAQREGDDHASQSTEGLPL